ncbi:MAG: pseudouridine synthase [Bacillus thermozeamaize]|uniref:Pseudouridine synthase n=1 Tax=Bacillus thermozeamaize TaxID=230954 RepID=A0A1Y3PZD7_9BACI|nr:MAG: pseudouridine synthase [Bacillus thermozeamaize]
MFQVRLQKVLAQAGVASRRKSEEWIRKGWVEVNGKVITQLGTKVNPQTDEIRVRGKLIRTEPKDKVYIIINKPKGVITSTSDPQGRRVVTDLVPLSERVFPVGRLDYDSEGLLLLTNDGELAYRMMHPRFEVEKVYLVWVKGRPTESDLQKLRDGIELEDGRTAPAIVRLLRVKERGGGYDSLCRIHLHEGRNRQVRRMFDAIGYPVLSLKRIQQGPLHLGDLKPGQFRFLSRKEVSRLKKMLDTKGS